MKIRKKQQITNFNHNESKKIVKPISSLKGKLGTRKTDKLSFKTLFIAFIDEEYTFCKTLWHVFFYASLSPSKV